jgi:proteasome lid subunit RPN8/RPN11
MAALTIPKEIFDKMIAHCISGYPNEVCGILAGEDGRVLKIYEMTNVEPSPVSYFMDPKEQFDTMKDMRISGISMLAIYHSHPASPAYPSTKDVSLAFYPDSVYIIVGLSDKDQPDVKVFGIMDGQVEVVKFIIRD